VIVSRLRSRAREWSPYVLGLGALLAVPPLLNVVPGVASGYVSYLISLGLIYAIVAIGLGLLVGYAGQISLGHAGFFAIGAYASALLTFRLGLPFVVALLAAGALSAAIGFLLGLPALRLSGPYLAVATLGFGLAIPQLAVWQGAWTGGSSGLHGLPLAALPLGAFTVVFRTDQDYYYLAAAVLLLLTIFARNVVTSHTGRAFVAIRDSELAARAMGVDLVRYKTRAFALSALYAGIAGGLYAHLVHGISPEDFTVLLSIDFLTMVVLGGLGSVGGAISGALFLTFVQNAVTRLPVVHDFKNLYIVVLGVVLILTIAFLPHGLAGVARSWRLRRMARTSPAASASRGTIVELGEPGRTR
jgi:branched-chain amino acid transport system permease protein